MTARERVVRLGSAPAGGLVGVLTDPSGGGPVDHAVVMLNSGILHRVGACRLHVKLARCLAAQGVMALRFDHSGIGDSEVRRDSLSFEKSAPLEVREALDWLANKRGVERFTLFGLCSGADIAFATALDEPRVAGLVLLDLWAYRTRRYWWVHYRKRITSAAAWRRILTRTVTRRTSERAEPGTAEEQDLDLPTYVRLVPPRERVAEDLRALVARDVRILCIFSEGQSDVYNHAGQMRAAFRDVPLAGHLEEQFVPRADHIFTNLEHQKTVIRSVSDWIGEADKDRNDGSDGLAGATSGAAG